MALFLFTRNILDGKPIDVFNHGHHRRDFTYVDDIAEGVVRAVDRPAQPDPAWRSDAPDPASSFAPFRLYNIGNNRPVQLMRYIEIIEECLGRKAQKNFLALQPGDVPVGARPGADDEEGELGAQAPGLLEEIVGDRRVAGRVEGQGDAGRGRGEEFRRLVLRLLRLPALSVASHP